MNTPPVDVLGFLEWWKYHIEDDSSKKEVLRKIMDGSPFDELADWICADLIILPEQSYIPATYKIELEGKKSTLYFDKYAIIPDLDLMLAVNVLFQRPFKERPNFAPGFLTTYDRLPTKKDRITLIVYMTPSIFLVTWYFTRNPFEEEYRKRDLLTKDCEDVYYKFYKLNEYK